MTVGDFVEQRRGSSWRFEMAFKVAHFLHYRGGYIFDQSHSGQNYAIKSRERIGTHNARG